MNSVFTAEEAAAVERLLTGVIEALEIETERVVGTAEHRRAHRGA